MRYSTILVFSVLLSSCSIPTSKIKTVSCCDITRAIITPTQKWTETRTVIEINQTPTITSTNIGNPLPLDPELSWEYKGEVEFSFPLMSNSITLKADYYFAICCDLLPASLREYYGERHMNEMGWVLAGGSFGPGGINDTYYYKPNNSYLTETGRGCKDKSKEWCINIWISK